MFEQPKDQENDENEVDENDLPIKLPNGIMMPNGAILRYANMREMCGTEEEILIRKQYSRDGSTIRRMLQNTTESLGPEAATCGAVGDKKTIDKCISDHMRLSDAAFLLVKLRLMSEDDDIFRYSLKCPHCESLAHFKVNLREHLRENTQYRPDDEPPKSEYKTVIDGVEYVYRPLMVRDNAEIAMVQRTDPHLALTAQIACSLISIGGKTFHSLAEVSALPKREFTRLRRLINECDYGMDLEILNACTHCNGEFRSKLPISSLGFFFPEASDS